MAYSSYLRKEQKAATKYTKSFAPGMEEPDVEMEQMPKTDEERLTRFKEL